MRSSIRKQDHLGRWGGEEFLFIFPETELEGGKIVCKKIRKTIADHVFEYKGQNLSVAMTFGISLMDDPQMSIEDCIKDADNAMYKGKQEGRNCVYLRHF